MNNSASAVGGRFLRLGIGEAGARVLSFGATVYLAHTLGASTYGVIAVATTVVMYLAFVADCGMDMLGVREVAAHPDALPDTLPRILGARFLVALLLVAGTAIFALTVLPRPDGPVLVAYSMTLFAVALGTRWVHLGLEQPGNASWARVLSEGTAALAVLASVHRPEQLLRVPLAQVAGEMLGAIFLLRMLPVAARPRRLAVGLGVIAPLITRSWPLVLHGLLGLAIFNSDLLFLRTLRDSAEVGYYAIAYTLISFFQNLGVNYTLSLIPSISRLRTDPRQSQQLFEGAMAQVFAGGLPVTVGGILVAASLIAFIFGPSYAPSVVPLQVLLLVVPVSLFRNVAQAVLIAHERQDLMLRTVAWAAAVNVVLNILLIARWGMIGAAVATVVTEAVRTVLALHYARRLGLVMAPLRRFVRATAAGVAMAIPVWALSDRSIILSIPVGAMAFVVALWGAGGIRLQRGEWPQLTV